MQKGKHLITKDMLDQSGPDSGLGHWNRYRGVDLEKTVETETQVNSKKYSMDLLP